MWFKNRRAKDRQQKRMMQVRHNHDRCSNHAETPPPEPNKGESNAQKNISPLIIPGSAEFNLKTGNR